MQTDQKIAQVAYSFVKFRYGFRQGFALADQRRQLQTEKHYPFGGTYLNLGSVRNKTGDLSIEV